MREIGTLTFTAKDLTLENRQLMANIQASEERNADIFQKWTKDKERLARWQLACLVLVGIIASAVLGLALR